jgi:hypothetical protein
MKWLFVLASVLPFGASAGSIYLCKAYAGGTFWASAHCNQHNALIERIANVPDGLPFDQQVNIANQQRQSAASTTTNSVTVNTTTVTNNNSAAGHIAECKALDASITQYDAMARQPQTGQMQDWITGEKKKARDRQFRIHC